MRITKTDVFRFFTGFFGALIPILLCLGLLWARLSAMAALGENAAPLFLWGGEFGAYVEKTAGILGESGLWRVVVVSPLLVALLFFYLCAWLVVADAVV